MSIRFPTLALAVAYTSYKANEDVWVGGGSALGDEVSGYYVFRLGADTPAGPGVIVVPNGRLERTSDPNAQFEALAAKTAEQLRPDLNDLEAKIGTMELTLSNALSNLPAQVAEHLKTGDPLSIAGQVSAVGGASAADIGTEVAAKVLDVNGLLPAKLSPDVVSAIGSAVNDAIRDGGPLPAPDPIRPEHPPGTPVGFPVSLTLTDGTERVIVVDGVALPRTLFIYRTGSDAITIRYRGAAGDPWVNFQTFTADSQVAIRDPIQALSVQRTAGSGTTSRVTLR